MERKSRHFVIYLAQPLAAECWIELVPQLYRYLGPHGYCVDVFDFDYEDYLEWLRSEGSTKVFEGFVDHPVQMDEAKVRQLMHEFCAQHGLATTGIELE